VDDSKASEALEEKYEISSWPTLLVIDTRGKMLGRVPGYTKGTGAAAIIAKLQSFLPLH
jgi:thioredoxin-related protein